MQRAGDHFFTGSGFTQQQNRQLISQALARHAQSACKTGISTGQGFKLRLFRGNFDGVSRRNAHADRTLRRAQNFVKKIPFYSPQVTHSGLM